MNEQVLAVQRMQDYIESHIEEEITMAMKNKQKHIPLQKTIWCKIRYWQLLHDWTDDELAMYLNCSTRTLQNYDHDARGLTLKMVDTFLCINDLTLDDLLAA